MDLNSPEAQQYLYSMFGNSMMGGMNNPAFDAEGGHPFATSSPFLPNSPASQPKGVAAGIGAGTGNAQSNGNSRASAAPSMGSYGASGIPSLHDMYMQGFGPQGIPAGFGLPNVFIPTNQGGFMGNHPMLARGLENAMIAMANFNPGDGPKSAGQNMAAAMRGLLAIPETKQNIAMQRMMMPVEMATRVQQYQNLQAQNEHLRAMADYLGAHGRYFDQRVNEGVSPQYTGKIPVKGEDGQWYWHGILRGGGTEQLKDSSGQPLQAPAPKSGAASGPLTGMAALAAGAFGLTAAKISGEEPRTASEDRSIFNMLNNQAYNHSFNSTAGGLAAKTEYGVDEFHRDHLAMQRDVAKEHMTNLNTEIKQYGNRDWALNRKIELGHSLGTKDMPTITKAFQAELAQKTAERDRVERAQSSYSNAYQKQPGLTWTDYLPTVK